MRQRFRANELHVKPVDDLIEHEDRWGSCVCGPRTEVTVREDGVLNWVIVHNSLDGRERTEGAEAE